MKNILFITIGMYNYEQEIEKELRNQGFDVTAFSTLPSYNMIERIYNKFTNDKYLKKKSIRKQKLFFENLENEFEYVFVIVGTYLDKELFEEYKRQHPNTKFILYLWDSIKKYEHLSWLISNFDQIYTFDSSDSKEFHYLFLPLFYLPCHVYKYEKKKYDLCLLGSWHDERMELWNKVIYKYSLERKKVYLFLLGGKFKHYLCWILPNKRKYKTKKYIHLFKMRVETTALIMKQSKATLDVQCFGQSGLTMRTIESIGTKTKIITTNENIKDYDFYDEQNIAVINRNNPEISEKFWNSPYKELPNQIMQKYNLHHWVKTIFEE